MTDLCKESWGMIMYFHDVLLTGCLVSHVFSHVRDEDKFKTNSGLLPLMVGLDGGDDCCNNP